MASDIGLTGIAKAFPAKAGEVLALEHIDLDVAPGEFVSVLGPSGCGKSTLLRIVAGLVPPSRGKVFVQGRAVEGPNPNVGIVFQSPVLLPWRTVLANIELPVEVRKLDRASHREKAQALIGLAGLAGFENSFPYQLSGGMQQRVSLCRALVHDPALLLMDEPFGALDALTREQMNLELQRIWMETRKTVLFITHSLAESVFLSDRVIVMTPRPGKIAAIIPVPLPRPRTLDSMRAPAFLDAVAEARTVMNTAGLSG